MKIMKCPTCGEMEISERRDEVTLHIPLKLPVRARGQALEYAPNRAAWDDGIVSGYVCDNCGEKATFTRCREQVDCRTEEELMESNFVKEI